MTVEELLARCELVRASEKRPARTACGYTAFLGEIQGGRIVFSVNE